MALGSANMFTSMFKGFVGAGSSSRTAVAENVGSETPLHALITGLFMLTSVLFLLPVFKWLPKCCLAAIVVVAVINLFDITAMIRFWRIKRKDFFVMLITLIATLLLDIQMGIGAGIAASILMLVQSASNPSFVILGRIPESNTFVDIKKEAEAEPIEGMLMIRWDENLFFGNIEIFKAKIDKEIEVFLKRLHQMTRMNDFIITDRTGTIPT